MTDQQYAVRPDQLDDARDSGDGGGTHDDLPGPGDSGGGRHRWRPDKTLLIVSLLVAIGLAMVVRGVLVGITGDERAHLPAAVESVTPVPDAVQVPNQTNVFVDLTADHTGVLVIDEVEIATIDVGQVDNIEVEPGEQVDLPAATIYEPGNATLTFTPGPGAPIETFDTGQHRAKVIYWQIDEGRRRARSYTWTFNVV